MVQIRKMGPQIGVEVSGVDRERSTTPGSPDLSGLADHNVLVVTGQELSIPEFCATSRRFGTSRRTREKHAPSRNIRRTSRCSASTKFGPDAASSTNPIYRRGAEGCTPTARTTPVPFKSHPVVRSGDP